MDRILDREEIRIVFGQRSFVNWEIRWHCEVNVRKFLYIMSEGLYYPKPNKQHIRRISRTLDPQHELNGLQIELPKTYLKGSDRIRVSHTILPFKFGRIYVTILSCWFVYIILKSRPINVMFVHFSTQSLRQEFVNW